MKLLGPAGLAAFGNLLGNWLGMPWQALLTYTVLAALCTTAIAMAQILVPQESSDKVQWWAELLRHRKRSSGRRPPRRQGKWP
jgi:hypothetical protein